MIPARQIAKTFVARVFVDTLIGALFAALLVVPAYLAYLRGYSDGDHDRAHWEREHIEQCTARVEHQHTRDNEWLNHVRHFYEQHYCDPDAGADAGARR